MADSSVQASIGTEDGAVFSTDLVGGEHVPLSKIAFGAYGTVTLVDSTTTNPFPIALSDTDKAVLDAVAASLVTIDLDTSNITACDTGAVVIASGTVTTVSTVTNLAQMGGVAISLNTGVRDTGTQRVTIATNDVVPISGTVTASGPVTDTELRATPVPISGSITNVSGTVSLPTNAATETTVAGLLTDTELRATPVPVSGTLTTVTTVTAVTDITNTVTVDNGGTFAVQVDAAAVTSLGLIDNTIVAHDEAVSVSTGLSVIGFEARSTEPTAVASADATRGLATLLGKQVTIPYAIPASTWNYATATLGVTDTATDEAKAAGAAGVINYVTSVQVINGHATTATEVVILDGASVMWRGWAEAAGGGVSAKFDPPLRGTAATAINVANITNLAKTYFNLQGYVASE